jgi:hypothetical protein
VRAYVWAGAHRSLRVCVHLRRMFLGSDIGWVDVMEYHDQDHDCRISMPELAQVCSAHYDACMSFLDSAHTTKGACPTIPQSHNAALARSARCSLRAAPMLRAQMARWTAGTRT